MKLIFKLYSKWIKLNPFAFILITTILSFILIIPIDLILIIFDIGENTIGALNYENYSVLGLFISVVIIVPVTETFLGQVLPIKLTQKIIGNKRNTITVFISAILFSLMHFVYSPWYCLLMFPMGILLANTYIIFQKRQESSFWVTTGVHSLRNLIGIIAIYSGI